VLFSIHKKTSLPRLEEPFIESRDDTQKGSNNRKNGDHGNGRENGPSDKIKHKNPLNSKSEESITINGVKEKYLHVNLLSYRLIV